MKKLPWPLCQYLNSEKMYSPLSLQGSGLGTTFFCVLNASFFCVLLKNAMFFYVLFSSFWQLMRPKRTMHSFAFFSKECKKMQRMQHSFAKNIKEHIERNILLQRTYIYCTYIYIYIYIYKYKF